MADSRKFGTEVWIALAVYLGLLLLLLVYAAVLRCIRARRTAPKENSLVEHFLAGRNLGPIALGFSVSASMFSGYTVVGLPAEAYSKGFSAWRWVGSCTFITIVYMAYAPRMQWLSRVRGHDSLCCYIKDRYGIAQQHRDPLHWLMVIVLLVPCFIYLCAQFDAFGNTISTLTGGAVTPTIGAVGLAALIAVFEILGGLHVVALTDVVQGVVLVAGAMLILISVDIHFEGLPAISKKLEVLDPSLVQVMDSAQGLSWAEFWIGVGVQRALFPDFPQRAMAASSQKSLRVGIAILALSPFLVQVPLLFFGIIGRVHHPNLENPKEIFTLVVLDIIYSDMSGKVVGSIMMVACLAAIMSTADSVLIVVSQIVTLDIIRPIQEAISARRSSHSASEVASAPPASPSAASEPGKVPPFVFPAASAAAAGPPPPETCQEPAPPFADPPPSSVVSGLMASTIDIQARVRHRNKRRAVGGRPPLLMGPEAADGQDPHSPIRMVMPQRGGSSSSSSVVGQEPSLHSTAPLPSSCSAAARAFAAERSLSPIRSGVSGVGGNGGGGASGSSSLAGALEMLIPATLRSSGSAPSLPPLPKILHRPAQRSRSVVGFGDCRELGKMPDSRDYYTGYNTAELQPNQRPAAHLFRTAPLPSTMSAEASNAGPGPLPLAAPSPQPLPAGGSRSTAAAPREGPSAGTRSTGAGQGPLPAQTGNSGRLGPRDLLRGGCSDDARLAPKLPTALTIQGDTRHWRESSSAAAVREGWSDARGDGDGRLPLAARSGDSEARMPTARLSVV